MSETDILLVLCVSDLKTHKSGFLAHLAIGHVSFCHG